VSPPPPQESVRRNAFKHVASQKLGQPKVQDARSSTEPIAQSDEDWHTVRTLSWSAVEERVDQLRANAVQADIQVVGPAGLEPATERL
jgi:hypothetical protein